MLDDHLIPSSDIEKEIHLFWRKKRLLYNIIVGTFGALAICFEIFFLARSWSFLLQILIPVIIFGLIANICYNLGVVAEKTFYKFTPNVYFKDLGLILFWIGTIWTVFFIFWMEYNIYTYETNPLPPIMR